MPQTSQLPNAKKPQVELVILDDDDLIVELISRVLKPYNCSVSGFSTHEGCLDYMQSVTPTHLFVDMNMPVVDGIQFITELKENGFNNTTEIFLCTGLLPLAEDSSKITEMHVNLIDKGDVFEEAWLCEILGLDGSSACT